MVRESITPQLEAKGYKVTLTEFTDGIQLNNALNEGSIDVNIFQHVPYLKGYRERTGQKLVEAFQVPNAPLPAKESNSMKFSLTTQSLFQMILVVTVAR